MMREGDCRECHGGLLGWLVPVSSALSLSFACCLLVYAMSGRGRSVSPRPIRDEDVDMDDGPANSNARVVIITNLTRNVLEPHLQTIFGFYGDIVKADVPLYAKCAYMLFL